MGLVTLPEFTREDLAGMAGWAGLRAGHALFEAGAVETVEWEQPLLRGRVSDSGTVYETVLNLRSTTFVQNSCQCPAGRAGRVCPHAVALCLAIRRRAQAAGVAAAGPSAARPAGGLPQTWMVVDGSPAYLAILLRDRADPRHKPCTEWLKAEGFRHEVSNGKWWLRDQHKVLNFLALNRARLEAEFDAGYTGGYTERMRVVQPVRLDCHAEKEGDGFRLRLELQARGLELRDIRDALVSGCHYIIRGDRVHLIEKGLVDKFTRASRALGGDPGLPMTGLFQARVSGPGLVDVASVLDDLDLGQSLPADWTERSAAIRQVGRLQPPPLQQDVAARLRIYQLIGAAWLWHLYRNRLGGVLADEMGLGKTIQSIGLLLCWRRAGERDGPALVVAPASLLGNWQRELAAWAPQLRVYRHHGPARLQAFWPDGGEPDVCLTSYSTLRIDSELFAAAAFSMVIADEAQHVKNRRTSASRSLRAVPAPARFVLTGTPIENSLEDLRALFDFCLPGYLRRPPADCRGEDREWHDKRHLQQAAPFILRRAKKMVAPELPEKIEQTIWCQLEERQLQLYQTVRERSQQAMLQLAASGVTEQRMRFALLTELLRLRQVCADPGLVEPDFPLEDSAKFQAFQELLEEALDGGHRILLFSQFVQLLKRLRAWLDGAGIPFAYIDGATPDRLAVCDRFNRDASLPLCLISLKAGGTGLNLTGADTVIHFDPWWNPAVEDQATDRAHRIGQSRTVTSYKLVTESTVEDKVLALQVKKAALLRELLDESAIQSAGVDLDTLKSLLS